MIIDVYIDMLFLIDLSMDIICFYITSSILKIHVRTLRVIAACSIGALYSVFALLYSQASVISTLCDVLICFAMVIFIYVEEDKKISYYAAICALYIGISMLLGGMMSAVFTFLNKLDIGGADISPDMAPTFIFAAVALASAVVSLHGIKLIGKKGRERLCRVRMLFGGREYMANGIIDSGNNVRSALGKNVIFIDRDIIADTIPRDAERRYFSGEYSEFCASAISVHTAVGDKLCVTFKPDMLYLSPQDNSGYTEEYESDCLISPFDSKSKEMSAIIPEEAIRII